MLLSALRAAALGTCGGGALLAFAFALAVVQPVAEARPSPFDTPRSASVRPLEGPCFLPGHLVPPPPPAAPRAGYRHLRARSRALPPPPLPAAADAFRVALRSARGSIQRCYDAELRTQPDLEGNFVVAVRVASDGHIALARVVQVPENAYDVAACITNRIRLFHLPEVREEAELMLPIHLETHPTRG